MPWAGNIAKIVTSNGKQFTVTREMLTAVSRHLPVTWLFFHRFDPFALLYNKSLMTGPEGNSEFCFPRISMFPETKILGKQNSLFPSGPVIKCLLFWAVTNYYQITQPLSQGLSSASLFHLKKTVVAAGHVTTCDKHFVKRSERKVIANHAVTSNYICGPILVKITLIIFTNSELTKYFLSYFCRVL